MVAAGSHLSCLDRLADRNVEQVLRYYRRTLRSEHYLLRQPHKRPIRHCPLGLGYGLPDIHLHCRLTRRDMRRLSHCGRSILLECHAVHEEIRTYCIVGDRVVDAGGELDCHYQYQFRRGAIDLVGDHAVEGRLCAECISDRFDVLGREFSPPSVKCTGLSHVLIPGTGNARLYAREYLRKQTSRPLQQMLHLLDFV